MLLEANMTSIDPVIREMCIPMKEKFDKYWHNYNVLLALAVVFDPRWKLNIIKYCYERIDPITSYDKVANVRSKLDLIFYEYSERSLPNSRVASSSIGRLSMITSHSSYPSSVSTISFDDAFDDYQDIYANMDHSSLNKSELETYLEEPILKPDNWKELDVLNWWKNNQQRFPVLSRMAADILSIPITSVASESAFSIGSRVLTKYRSSILPANVQALICTRNWLYGFKYDDNGGDNVYDSGEEMKRLDIFASEAEEESTCSEAQSNVLDSDDGHFEEN